MTEELAQGHYAWRLEWDWNIHSTFLTQGTEPTTEPSGLMHCLCKSKRREEELFLKLAATGMKY